MEGSEIPFSIRYICFGVQIFEQAYPWIYYIFFLIPEVKYQNVHIP